jgi:hypothetical protein
MSESLGKTEFTYNPDSLIAGDFKRVDKAVIIETGQGVLNRGAVLGEISRELGTIAADAGNTGNGTFGSAAMKASTQKGQYKLLCSQGGASATFTLLDPQARVLKSAIPMGSVEDMGELAGQITAGGVDFAQGDFFYY